MHPWHPLPLVFFGLGLVVLAFVSRRLAPKAGRYFDERYKAAERRFSADGAQPHP